MHSIRRPVNVLKSGLVVSIDAPYLGASPDGKVIDSGCLMPFGLLEVKCPETKFLVTPLDACSDSNFFLENQNGELKLKRNHKCRDCRELQAQDGVTLWFTQVRVWALNIFPLMMNIGKPQKEH